MRIHSIFTSLDGEVNAWGQGIPSIFIRLQGCNLGDETCPWCDTKDSRNPTSGKEVTVDQVLAEIFSRVHPEGLRKVEHYPKVTITGGEPLLQEDAVHKLLNRLFTYGIRVSIETNGTCSLARFRNLKKPDPNVCLVVDWKFDDRRISTEQYNQLASWDWIKFVIKDRIDYEVTKGIIQGKVVDQAELPLDTQARIAFAPVHERLPGKTLAQWILADRLWWVTLNIQLHKFIFLP